MKNSLKVALSCALGAVVGILFALQFNYNFWLGLIVGGAVAFAVGYTTIDFKTIVESVPEAWDSTVEEFGSWYKKTDFKYWLRLWGYQLLLGGSGLLMLMIYVYAEFHDYPSGTCSILGWLGSIPLLLQWSALYSSSFSLGRENSLRLVKWQALHLNAFSLPFTLFYYCAYWVPTRTYEVIRDHGKTATLFISRFITKLFWQIHSELRLLCGTYAATGAVIGYCFHSVIIGLLVGGSLGTLTYVVVSKLVPHRMLKQQL